MYEKDKSVCVRERKESMCEREGERVEESVCKREERACV